MEFKIMAKVKWHHVYGGIINSTHRALRRGSMDIQGAKEGLQRLLLERSETGEKLWERFIIVAGDGTVLEDTTQNPLASFREFVEAEPLRGLGQSVADIERLLADDPEAMVALREELTADKGGKNNMDGIGGKSGKTHIDNNNNIIIDKNDLFTDPPKQEKPKKKSTQGTRKAYTLSRLKKNDPELFEAVKAGDLSVNAAALKAGYRKPMRSVPIDSPESAIRSLARVFPIDDLLRVIGEMMDERDPNDD
jgi:hypothetical protein